MSTSLSPWDDLAIPPQARGRGVTLNLFDQPSAYVPQQPGAYLRISSDSFGLEAGVDRQNDDTEDTRHHLRWGRFAKVHRENNTSAFKKRKIVWADTRPSHRPRLSHHDDGFISATAVRAGTR